MGCRKDGNTSEIVKYFESKMKSLGEVNLEYLYLSDYPIDFCVGCHNCIFIGEDKCPHYDAVRGIENKILSSDGIILASPGYMFSVTGIMKNFLDHVAYNCHRPKYFGKKIYLISSCTKWQEKTVFGPMEAWTSAAGFKLSGKTYVDMLPLPFNDKELNMRRGKLDKAALGFWSDLKTQAELKPVMGNIIVFHVFRTLCKIAPNILRADYHYFKEIKAYDKNSKWYVPARISFFSHRFATFMEKKMEKEITKLIDIEKLNGETQVYKNKL